MGEDAPGRLGIGGYVLAGGRSSRMGRDKALLELGGKPLVARAVETLRRVCAEVRVVSGNTELAAFARLVGDLHPGCGPVGGIEAALADSEFDWNLVMAVDIPFLPAAELERLVRAAHEGEESGARIGVFAVEGMAQPAVVMIHREALPGIAGAIERGELRLEGALAEAGREMAMRRGVSVGEAVVSVRVEERRWFANLNTPEEFAEAEELGA